MLIDPEDCTKLGLNDGRTSTEGDYRTTASPDPTEASASSSSTTDDIEPPPSYSDSETMETNTTSSDPVPGGGGSTLHGPSCSANRHRSCQRCSRHWYDGDEKIREAVPHDLPLASNYVAVSKRLVPIHGTWVVDPTKFIPSSLLPPLIPGETRRNLSLETRSAGVSADVWITPTKEYSSTATTVPDAADSEHLRRKVVLHARSVNAGMTFTIHDLPVSSHHRYTSQALRAPLEVTLRTSNGATALGIPRSFRGVIAASTRNGQTRFSDAVRSKISFMGEESSVGWSGLGGKVKVFVGAIPTQEEEEGRLGGESALCTCEGHTTTGDNGNRRRRTREQARRESTARGADIVPELDDQNPDYFDVSDSETTLSSESTLSATTASSSSTSSSSLSASEASFNAAYRTGHHESSGVPECTSSCHSHHIRFVADEIVVETTNGPIKIAYADEALRTRTAFQLVTKSMFPGFPGAPMDKKGPGGGGGGGGGGGSSGGHGRSSESKSGSGTGASKGWGKWGGLGGWLQGWGQYGSQLNQTNGGGAVGNENQSGYQYRYEYRKVAPGAKGFR